MSCTQTITPCTGVGTVCGITRDSFFYVFGRARDAALAAADAHRALDAHEWPEGGEVRIRVGMHTGEPVVSDEGYHGIGVHRAARIMAAGHGGQVLLSEATAAVLGDEEVAGIGLLDLGRHQLKDLDRPEHLYQLVAEGLATDFPRVRTAAAPRPMYLRPLVIGTAAGVLAAAVAIPVFAFRTAPSASSAPGHARSAPRRPTSRAPSAPLPRSGVGSRLRRGLVAHRDVLQPGPKRCLADQRSETTKTATHGKDCDVEGCAASQPLGTASRSWPSSESTLAQRRVAFRHSQSRLD